MTKKLKTITVVAIIALLGAYVLAIEISNASWRQVMDKC